MKKYLSELTREELENVYENNYKLQYEVAEDYQERKLHYVGEILDTIKRGLKNWSIGFYNHNFIVIKDNISFLKALLDVQKSYALLDDKYTQKIEETIAEYWRQYYTDQEDENFKDDNELEGWLDNKTETFADLVIDAFNNITTMPRLVDYFIDCYADNIADAYVDEDYRLYQDTVKCYF